MFTCLTLPSKLTQLDLALQSVQQPLPLGAVQYMFPAQRQLTQLQSLSIWSDCNGNFKYDPVDDARYPECIDAAGLRSILHVCLNLRMLDVRSTVVPGDTAPLLLLPKSCRHLLVGGRGFGDADAAVVAQLTQLSRLTLTYCPQLTDAGLEELTALKALCYLKAENMTGLSSGLAAPPSNNLEWGPECTLESEDPDHPSVWQQLQTLCQQVPVNAGWRRRLDAQAQQAERLRQQNADLQRRVADLERQLRDVAA